MNIQIVRGRDADLLLADERFLAEWTALCAQCPWATAFQTHGFARAWYSTYRDQFEPVLLLSRAQGGASQEALQGLLALAFSPTDRSLIVAGRHQAEYHAWVSTPPLGNAFPWHAAELLRREFPSARLTFHYLAPNAPTDWAVGPEGRRRCLLKSHRRPLVRFGDGRANAESLAKRSNKRKLKDLEKMGELRFERLTDPAEFEAVFDDIVRLYDFRHGAVQGSDPFCGTKRQKQFHVAMMKVPGLLHVTVMRVGGRLAAAHFGAASGKELQLGTIVHEPGLAKQSPGKFQILLLCKMLIGEGFERLDLTPGGDAYKERFANAWDEVHTLDVLTTRRGRTKAFVYARAKDAFKATLQRMDVTTAQARHDVRACLWELRHPAHLALKLAGRAGGWVGSRRETRVYSREVGKPLAGIAVDVPVKGVPPLAFRRDALDDLLAYRPVGAGPSRQTFLSAALAHVEEGQHVYTHADDAGDPKGAKGGRLAHYGWMAVRPAAEVVEALAPGLSLPPDSVLLHGLFTSAADPGRSLAPFALRAMLSDAARASGLKRAFLLVPGDSAPALHLAEEFGFTWECSVIEEIRFGKRLSKTLGRNGAERLTAAPPPAEPAAKPAIEQPAEPVTEPPARQRPFKAAKADHPEPMIR